MERKGNFFNLLFFLLRHVCVFGHLLCCEAYSNSSFANVKKNCYLLHKFIFVKLFFQLEKINILMFYIRIFLKFSSQSGHKEWGGPLGA